jgi:hypothetical protein
VQHTTADEWLQQPQQQQKQAGKGSQHIPEATFETWLSACMSDEAMHNMRSALSPSIWRLSCDSVHACMHVVCDVAAPTCLTHHVLWLHLVQVLRDVLPASLTVSLASFGYLASTRACLSRNSGGMGTL